MTTEATNLPPIALTIAGSDCGAGAGIQADLKTFCAHQVFGATVVTLVTAQNTQGVTGLEMVAPGLIEKQLEAVFSDFNIAALKTGALGNRQTIELVASYLKRTQATNLVVDPVMISKHGHWLIEQDAVPALSELLLPLSTVATPNLLEAAELAGMETVRTKSEMLVAAKLIAKFGCKNVVIKGGHISGDPVDLVWDGSRPTWLEAQRINSPHTHGTGCTFSAAICANLAQGLPVIEAVSKAKAYISGAISNAVAYGKGINPVNHFWDSHK